MKKALHKIANRFGYAIHRIETVRKSGPFAEMGRLCMNIEQPVIFDIGAHHGQTAKLFRDVFPQAHIYCFEPFAESYEILKQNTASDVNISTFNYGLSDRNAVLEFHSNSFPQTNSLLSTDCQGSETWEEGVLDTKEIVEAEFRTLESVVRDLQLPRVNILKLDVQGAEYLVLQGAGLVFQKGLVDIVYSEVITQPTYVNQKRFDQALKVYYDCGFDLHNIYNCNFTGAGVLRQVDVLFTQKK